MKKVFIDGSAGTTGLRIYDRLKVRSDISLFTLPDAMRKDTGARRQAINSADIVFLCLPDAASVEAAALCENPETVLIDTSTAHRTNPDWVYGFPEISDRRRVIRSAKRIANPGCHASGFISLVAPLVEAGMLSPDEKLTCFSVTGYSGGGKKMIAQYEAETPEPLLSAPRQYGLTQNHKHLPEMQRVCGLRFAPCFCPIVAPYYSGMEVTVPLFATQLKGTKEQLCALYRSYYTGSLVAFHNAADEEGFLSAGAFSGKDSMELSVSGNEERILLTARFDNLGKGASGSAIQNMNIVLGVDETTGLII